MAVFLAATDILNLIENGNIKIAKTWPVFPNFYAWGLRTCCDKTVGCFRYYFCKFFGHDGGKNSLKKGRKKEKNIKEKS